MSEEQPLKVQEGIEGGGESYFCVVQRSLFLTLPAIGTFCFQHGCQIQIVPVRKGIIEWPVHQTLEFSLGLEVII